MLKHQQSPHSFGGAQLAEPTVHDHVDRFRLAMHGSRASLTHIDAWLADLRARYRFIGRPPADMPSVRPLLGYSFRCVDRGLDREILSYPKEVFGQSRTGFVNLLSTLLAYFPELTLSLEMADDVGLTRTAGRPGATTVQPSDARTTAAEDWMGLFEFLEEVRDPVADGILHLTPADFFHDGSRTIFTIESLSQLEFFARGKGMVAASFAPDVRADLGVGLSLRADFLTDTSSYFEGAAETFATFGGRISLVRYPRLVLPWFTPQSFRELRALRAEQPMLDLHRWFSSASDNQARMIDLTRAVAGAVSSLRGRHAINAKGSIGLSVAAVASEFPNPIINLPIDCVPIASWLAGSDVRHFSHWFQRRSAANDWGIMVLLVCLEIL